jgi:orotate phosphoribosyltransferase
MNNQDKKYIAEKTAEIFLEIGAVSFRFNPPFTFTSGLKSPIYLDNRIILSYPHARHQIIDFYIEMIRKNLDLSKIDYISATASAAIPQGSIIAYRLGLPMIYVRPTTKSYGKGNKLEGYFKKGSQTLIIEDHISTASSVVNNALTIREEGGKVNYCVATTTYETVQSKENFKKYKLKLIYLTTGKTIVEMAFKRGIINEEEKRWVDLWFADSKNWEKIFLKNKNEIHSKT